MGETNSHQDFQEPKVFCKFVFILSIQEEQIVVDAIKPYHPIQIGVFGSVARGDDQKDSVWILLIH